MFYPPAELKKDRGSVMLEAIICLPFLFLLIFLTAQLAHISFCRQVVQYAAVAAGRATISCADSEEKDAAEAAARRICALVSYTNEGGSPLNREWLKDREKNVLISGTGGADPQGKNDKMKEVTVSQTGVGSKIVTVKFNVPMMFPIANDVLSGSSAFIKYIWQSEKYREREITYKSELFPHFLITGTTAVFKPASVGTSAVDNVNDYKRWN
ncbi:MAG: pilus assembly protein [Lentisphaeria bacterium]|nr:pilus assembly protein [Lentisphaeria bacterium]